ncbi:MAG: hypothetical protein ACRDA3_00070 [Peptostreptococcaceae bacterium]
MAIKTMYLIGDRFKNNCGYEYEVIGYCKSNRRRIVRFDSGYETEISTGTIISGKIKDLGRPTVFGIGIMGGRNLTKHFLFMRWMNMIGRCYCKSHAQYRSYGAKGIVVEEYLRTFSNYIEFVSRLDGYDLMVRNPSKYQIDKDIAEGSCRNYYRKNLKIVLSSENIEEENRERRLKVRMKDSDDNIICVFESMTEAERETGIHRGNIARTARGESNFAGGYKWERVYEGEQ